MITNESLYANRHKNHNQNILIKNILLSISLIVCYALWILFVYPLNYPIITIDDTTNIPQSSFPLLEEINIKNELETSESSIKIEGKLPQDLSLKINNEDVSIEEGKFIKEINLSDGDNLVEIIIQNHQNYFSKTIYNIKKIPIPSQVTENKSQPTDTSSPTNNYQCNNALAERMLTLINEYRSQNSKNTLVKISNLDNAACSHSVWMSNSNILSHTGENGSQFYQRCEYAGAVCDAENIANGTADADTIFNLWKNSSGHNANMLGDHTQIGIGESGGYWTTVFY